MKKLLLIALIALSFQQIQAQEIYLQTGKNFTQYDYKSGTDSSPSLQSGSGNFYEIGYVMTLNNEKLKYAVGLSLNEYNSLGGDINSSYSWNTQYMGIECGYHYSPAGVAILAQAVADAFTKTLGL